MSNIVYIVLIILLLIFVAYGLTKKVIHDKKVKKEDRLY